MTDLELNEAMARDDAAYLRVRSKPAALRYGTSLHHTGGHCVNALLRQGGYMRGVDLLVTATWPAAQGLADALENGVTAAQLRELANELDNLKRGQA